MIGYQTKLVGGMPKLMALDRQDNQFSVDALAFAAGLFTWQIPRKLLFGPDSHPGHQPGTLANGAIDGIQLAGTGH